MEALTHTAKRRGLLLDPRTKLLMLVTVTSLMRLPATAAL